MSALLTSLLLGLRQLFDPQVLRILGKSIAVSLLVFLVLAAAGWWAIDLALSRAGLAGRAFAGADTVRGVASVVGAVLALWLLWRIVAMAVIQFYADEVVQAVEWRHYPREAALARELTFAQQLRLALGAGLRALVANLVALPFALVLMFTGFGPALLFLLVNAVLLGRELQDMVWQRHRNGRADPAPLPGSQRLLLGGAVAGLMMVPFVHFVAPLLGAASAAHLVHRARWQEQA